MTSRVQADTVPRNGGRPLRGMGSGRPRRERGFLAEPMFRRDDFLRGPGCPGSAMPHLAGEADN